MAARRRRSRSVALVRRTPPFASSRVLKSVALGETLASSAVTPITFPTTPLKLKVMVALGANLSDDPLTWPWEDITLFVRFDLGVSLTTGRTDGSGQVNYGRAQLKLDNRDGRFCRRNPLSPYYGLLSKNTPIWATIDAGSGEHDRLQMFVNEWPTRWSDKSATDSTVTVACAGILRRIGQGKRVTSALRRATEESGPVASWPLEDGRDTDQAASGPGGGNPGTVFTGVEFGSDGPAGAMSAVSADTPEGLVAGTSVGCNIRFDIPNHTRGTEVLTMHIQGDPFDVPPSGGVQVTVRHRLEFTTGGGLGWADISLLSFDSSGGFSGTIGYKIQFYDTAGVLVATLNTGIPQPSWNPFDGDWHQMQLVAVQNGANIDTSVYVDDTLGDSTTMAARTLTTMNTLSVGTAGFYQDSLAANLAPFTAPYALSFVMVHNVFPDFRFDAVSGFDGEMAHDRIVRLCDQEDVLVETLASVSATMGPQGAGTLASLLREAEAVDGGVLYEKRWGLAYKSLHEFYNQPVSLALDFNAKHIADLPEPADDDQRTVNLVTVNRTDGTEYTAEDDDSPMGTGPGGPGTWPGSATLPVEADSQVANQAEWRVHLGTIDEDRWPNIGLNFKRNPTLIDTWCAMPFGARATVANPPTQITGVPVGSSGTPDPLDLIREGHSEAWNGLEWTASLNCSPASAYRVVQVGSTDGNLGRVDAANSTLAAAVDSTTTTLLVASPGALWVTGAVSFDIGISGERMTVTNIAGSSSPQTFTVTRSVNGVVKAQPTTLAGRPVKVSLWKTPVYGL